jgi:hypothetical protein
MWLGQHEQILIYSFLMIIPYWIIWIIVNFTMDKLDKKIKSYA